MNAVAPAIEYPADPAEPPGSAATVLRIVRAIAAAYPEAFAGVRIPWPESRPSRRAVAALLTHFELRRLASVRRTEIARSTVDQVHETFLFRAGHEIRPIGEAFRGGAAPSATEEACIIRPAAALTAPGDPHLEAPCPGEISSEAARALEWTARQLSGRPSTTWSLGGQRFVLLGGTAELAPLSRLLAAGADVLSTHTSAESLAASSWFDLPAGTAWKGRLFTVPGGIDLLTCPVAFAEAALAFAGAGRVHVGAFAYRGGLGREWRLTAAMEGIVRRLRQAGALASLTAYLSPSIPTELSEETAEVARSRFRAESRLWRDAARTLTAGLLFQPNVLSASDVFVSRSFVPAQGSSYMAGNLFGKNYVSEVVLRDPVSPDATATRVSANVAPLTATRSTRTDTTARLFPRLAGLGIRVFEPAETREIMYRLMLHDLFGPPRPAGRPFNQQVHGGIFTSAYALESNLATAYGRYWFGRD